MIYCCIKFLISRRRRTTSHLISRQLTFPGYILIDCHIFIIRWRQTTSSSITADVATEMFQMMCSIGRRGTTESPSKNENHAGILRTLGGSEVRTISRLLPQQITHSIVQLSRTALFSYQLPVGSSTQLFINSMYGISMSLVASLLKSTHRENKDLMLVDDSKYN